MLLIILSWLYITCIAYMAGASLLAVLRRIFCTEGAVEMHFSVICFCGLMLIAFISMLLCLVMPLGLASNVLILAVVLTGAMIFRKTLAVAVKADRERLREGGWMSFVGGLLFLAYVFVIAYISHEPSSHYDDGLYYSTSIKWLQEYGTVKGLANLNPRIAFNSSWLVLQANFGFQFLRAGLFNDMNGLIDLWVVLYAIGGLPGLLKGRAIFRNALRVCFLVPALAFHYTSGSELLLLNVNFIESPSPDIPTLLLCWMIFLLFAGSRPEEEKRGVLLMPDLLGILFSVWVCTIKLSALPILLLACYTGLRLLIAGRWRQAALLVVFATLFFAPWIYRTAMLSGYLFFPFAAIDVLHVPWKLPLREALKQGYAIKAFALGADINKPFSTPFLTWFPSWAKGRDLMRRLILLTAAAAGLIYAGAAVRGMLSGYAWVIRCRRVVILVITGAAGILFWIWQGPDFRFGYGFLIFFDLFFIMSALHYLLGSYLRFFPAALVLYLVWMAGTYYARTWSSIAAYVAPELPYRMPTEVRTILIPAVDGGHERLQVVPHDDSWNAPLPVANEGDIASLSPVCLGTRVADGFRSGLQK